MSATASQSDDAMSRKKKGSDERGAPAWIVTFSDLMSLLLTFFVLLLSFSTISEEDFNQAMASLQGALGIMSMHDGMVAFHPRPQRQARQQETERAARRLRRQLQVEGLEMQVKIEYDAQGGLKIILPNAVLFDSASADLKPEALPLLQDIGSVLAELPDTFIEVRGHTDALPTSPGARFRDNYDLSYFRAYAVADRLAVAGGVPEEQFEIVASGANQPVATNATEEGRAANRRVELYVRGLVDQRRMESLEASPGEAAGAPLGTVPVSPRELEEFR